MRTITHTDLNSWILFIWPINRKHTFYDFFLQVFCQNDERNAEMWKNRLLTLYLMKKPKKKYTESTQLIIFIGLSPFPFYFKQFFDFQWFWSLWINFELIFDFESILFWFWIDFFWIDICSLWFTYEFTWKTYLSWFYSFEKNLYCFSWINLSKIYQLSLIRA